MTSFVTEVFLLFPIIMQCCSSMSKLFISSKVNNFFNRTKVKRDEFQFIIPLKDEDDKKMSSNNII